MSYYSNAYTRTVCCAMGYLTVLWSAVTGKFCGTLRVLFVCLTVLSLTATTLNGVSNEQELEQESEGSLHLL
jgi:hypothetical protein